MSGDKEKLQFDYRIALGDELRTRNVRNPRYSLRCFARDLGVSVTALSDVLTGKRNFSARNAARVMDRLGWSPLQRESFLESIARPSVTPRSRDELLLPDDLFHFISDWYYLPILNWARVKGAKSSPQWLSQRLGISSSEAREAIERLKRLGYIETTGGRLTRLAPPVHSTTEIPSSAIRKYHRQNFQVAELAQETVPFELRQISSFTVATDSERIARAKKMLVDFMRRLESVLESDQPTEVFTVSTQMFPAQIIREKIR